MRRIRIDHPERGVIAPMTAFLMVFLLGMAAFAVDVGSMYSEHSQLQNGADAAALAIAQKCAKLPAGTTCAADQTTEAAPFANGNTLDTNGQAIVATVTGGTVDVTTQAQDPSAGNHFSLVFAHALGIQTADIRATAQAKWIYPTKGRTVLPLVFSSCEFVDDGLSHTILTQGGGHGAQDCNGRNPSNQIIPGGFAWLAPDAGGGCNVTANVGSWSQTSTGGSIPTGCGSLFDSSLIGKTVALPVYAYTCAGITATGSPNWGNCTGNNAYYKITKWAGFKVLGFNFPGSSAGDISHFGPSEKGLYGTFVGYAADPTLFSGGSSTPTGNVIVLGLTK